MSKQWDEPKFKSGDIVFFNNKKYIVGGCHGLIDWDDKPVNLKVDWLQYRYSLYDEDDDCFNNPIEAFELEIKNAMEKVKHV